MDNISAKMSALRGKVSELERAAAQRKAKLDENSAFLQFNWKADVVESWICMHLPSFLGAVSFQNKRLLLIFKILEGLFVSITEKIQPEPVDVLCV